LPDQQMAVMSNGGVKTLIITETPARRFSSATGAARDWWVGLLLAS